MSSSFNHYADCNNYFRNGSLNFPDIENGSITVMRSGEQRDFIKAAMAQIVERNYTYYIGGSNYNPSLPSDASFMYCPVNSGTIFQMLWYKKSYVLKIHYFACQKSNSDNLSHFRTIFIWQLQMLMKKEVHNFKQFHYHMMSLWVFCVK